MRSDAEIAGSVPTDAEGVHDVESATEGVLNSGEELNKGGYVIARRSIENSTWIFIEGIETDLKSARRYAREQVEPGTEVAILRVTDTKTVGARVMRSLK